GHGGSAVGPGARRPLKRIAAESKAGAERSRVLGNRRRPGRREAFRLDGGAGGEVGRCETHRREIRSLRPRPGGRRTDREDRGKDGRNRRQRDPAAPTQPCSVSESIDQQTASASISFWIS